jgi:hypothetical protein
MSCPLAGTEPNTAAVFVFFFRAKVFGIRAHVGIRIESIRTKNFPPGIRIKSSRCSKAAVFQSTRQKYSFGIRFVIPSST